MYWGKINAKPGTFDTTVIDPIDMANIPEQAWGGNGKISVVEDFLRATAQPRLCGLKDRSWFIKSEHSIRATSAKWRSHKIWFLKRRARFCKFKGKVSAMRNMILCKLTIEGKIVDVNKIPKRNGKGGWCPRATRNNMQYIYLIGSRKVDSTGVAS